MLTGSTQLTFKCYLLAMAFSVALPVWYVFVSTSIFTLFTLLFQWMFQLKYNKIYKNKWCYTLGIIYIKILKIKHIN